MGKNMSQMCEDCKALVEAPRSTKPHANLEYLELEGKRFSSPMGAADEAYYVCKVCKTRWTHETGSCGMGWI